MGNNIIIVYYGIWRVIMRINASTIVVAFEEIKIETKFDELEKLFNQFQIGVQKINLPDDAPAEIPRFFAHSNFGHSNIIVNNQSIQISTVYDDEYGSDSKRVYEYIFDRLTIILKAIEILQAKMTYSGLTINTEEDIDDPVAFISSEFLKIKSKSVAFDNSINLVYVVNDSYFVNINLGNLNVYKNIPNNLNDKFDNAELIGHKLGIVIDINDKYLYSQNQKYFTTEESARNIIEYSKKIIETTVPKMLQKGEVDI